MNRLQQRVLLVTLCIAGFFLFVYGGYSRLETQRTASLLSQPPTVVIDAGHGGEDGGATSVSGALESALNLEIALRVRDLLTFAGVPTMMLRETDTALYSEGAASYSEKKVSDLKNRVSMVNAVPNGVLLSIHQNTFPEAKYRGSQVFYARAGDSQTLAQRTQTALRTCLDPGNRRECKPADSVYLMEHIECTGILVECGFLSNPAEDKALQTPGYQKKLAAALCGALTIYIEGTKDEV